MQSINDLRLPASLLQGRRQPPVAGRAVTAAARRVVTKYLLTVMADDGLMSR